MIILIVHNLEGVSERRKLAILRSSLGAESFWICADLCLETNLGYDETVQRLKHRFAPVPSHRLARACLNRRLQQAIEDVGQYTTALPALFSKCGYLETVV